MRIRKRIYKIGGIDRRPTTNLFGPPAEDTRDVVGIG